MKTFTLPGLLIILSIGLWRCKKNMAPDNCGQPLPVADFRFQELIADTAFDADTVFRDNYVQFIAGGGYNSVTWKIGNDPALFSQPQFALSLQAALGPVTVQFSGNDPQTRACFPLLNGWVTGAKTITVLEQLEKPLLTLSPLTGRYRGAFTTTPADTFTVTIAYLDSAKYDAQITGSKNFYWLINMPNGFTGTTPAATAYPELKHGMAAEMGYKCFAFGASASSLVQGRGWLLHDTLFINYGNHLSGIKKFIGKRI